MIDFGIGWAIGFLNAVVLLFLAHRPAVNRTINQVQTRLKPKGSIIEPDNPELEQWLADLKHEEASPM